MKRYKGMIPTGGAGFRNKIMLEEDKRRV